MGGLGIGDLGLIFGNPGGGKSWMLVNLGAQAVVAGFNVAHYTLELSEDYVGKRYDALFTGIDAQQLHLHKDKVNSAIEKLKGKLIIKEFPMGKAGVNTIEAHIQKCRDLGSAPDIVIIDYVDLLKSKTRSIDPKDAIDDIYSAVKGMARELKVPVWTVSQVNRCHNVKDTVETPNGKVRIGDLKTGDQILTHKGFKKVTKVYPIQKQPTYRIKLKNGKEINVSANHIVPTQYGKLKSIATGLKVGDKLFVKK
jgi:replicative DNA helicase